MKVLKFGGTSVGSVQRMKDVAGIVRPAGGASRGNIVVLSAMSGTTNTLVEIAGYLYNRNREGARDTITALRKKYLDVVEELYDTSESKEKARAYVLEVFGILSAITRELFGDVQERIVLAQGDCCPPSCSPPTCRSRESA